jgi:UDP-N-acetylglucosamine 2-epimerase (non-hydrolysing)
MIAFFYGTSAELIKLAPIMRRLQDRGVSFEQWVTAQHVSHLEELTSELGLPAIDRWLSRGVRGGGDLVRVIDVPLWLLGICWAFISRYGTFRRALRKDGRAGVLVVHGDTMTTPLGALFGRLLGARVAHVEAGMRSFDLRNPFPEEIDRRLTAYLAHVHYAPGTEPAHNVRNRGAVVDTHHNTVRDSIDLALANVSAPAIEQPFGVVSLHRQELINNRDVFTRTIDYLIQQAEDRRILFIDHNVTVEAMARFGILERFQKSKLIHRPRMSYFEFAAALENCEFLFTDSGGGQQETYFLDRPCLVHRLRTEMTDGEGASMVLSRFDFDVVDKFFENPGRFKHGEQLPQRRPSDIIIDDMVGRGWV